MKKFFITAVCIAAMLPGAASACKMCISRDSAFIGMYNCGDENQCNACNNTAPSETTFGGVTTVGTKCWTVGSLEGTKCGCATTFTYKCASGYYGTATSATSGCTKCPENATCAGGNGSTFSCAKGYYKDGTSCARCPSSGGVYGTTASTGATSITDCYLPSGTTFSDSTGSGTYTSNCYYVE